MILTPFPLSHSLRPIHLERDVLYGQPHTRRVTNEGNA